MAGWFLLHLLVGLTGTWMARRYALRRNLVDPPGERRSHVVPTPRGGGMAIVASLVLACGWWLAQPGAAPPMLPAFLLGILLVGAVGFADDHRPLPPWPRLFVHAVAAALLAWGAWRTWGGLPVAVAAGGLALVLTNAWNFMDGIDGLAASQALLVAIPLALVGDGPWAWIAWALVAACAGFLPFNFPRARIFLGDVGSGVLGFALAGLLVAVVARAPGYAWMAWSLPLSAFLVDTGLTLAGRMWRGEPWWRAHALHAYQRWARRIGSHVPVTLAYAAWTGMAILGIWLLRAWHVFPLATACVAWYAAGSAFWLLLQGRGVDAVQGNRE
jgi:UDP-N-acetylmuramyl pentapeptide phosphotransferase/UDP-N-acetylglucosamine-1-phosphate transferase